MSDRPRIFLSPPHMSGDEIGFIKDAFATNWISPLGPHVDAFEREVAEYTGVAHAAAVSSGTAALHLALILAGVAFEDDVMCSTFTFSASANAVMYQSAKPIFIDCDASTWNINPDILEEELNCSAKRGAIPKAIIVVDLYGQCADYNRIEKVCKRYGITLIEDAAEALGSTCGGKRAGSFGQMGALSFNGNKIITTSGGGMLLSDDEALIKKARFLATQARDPAPYYQHSTVGYNYRMSNVLAGIGRGQIKVLDDRVRARRDIFDYYRKGLGYLAGLSFMPEASYGLCNRWLTCILIEADVFGANRDDIRFALAAENIESRPLWKPMHLQPVFSGFRVVGGAVSEELFNKGLCLPSGSNLAREDQDRIIEIICGCCVA